MMSGVLTYTAGCGGRALEVYTILGVTEIMDAVETARGHCMCKKKEKRTNADF